jgi:hypothetical protein
MDGVVRSQDPSGWSKVGLSGAVLSEGAMRSPSRTVFDGHGLSRDRAGLFKLAEARLIAMGYANHRKKGTEARHSREKDVKKAVVLK